MKLPIYALALLFCLFPYTQLFPLSSYTQPYALIFSAVAALLALPTVWRTMNGSDLVALLLLAGLGLAAFLLTALPGPGPQEFKYLLIYVSPIVFALAAFGIVIEAPRLADRVVLFAALAWIFVGVVQAVISPDFMTQFVGEFSEVSDDVVASGRGTLGLAPEPTHFGFHMVLLAALAVLIGGRNLLALACLVTAVLAARSSSALLALSLGALIYLLLYGGWMRLALAALVPLYLVLGLVIDSGMLPQSVRAVVLLTEFYNDPLYLVTSDASTNARLGGIFVGVQESLHNWLIPAGIDHEQWLARIGPIQVRNNWLIFLSTAGVPSGILIVVYQTGIFGMLVMAYLLYRMLHNPRSHIEAFLSCSVVFVFFSQYMLSTPGFGVIIGVVFAREHFIRSSPVTPLAPQSPPPASSAPQAAYAQ